MSSPGLRFPAIIDNAPVWTGFAPWPSCPDVLYDKTSRTLCGLAYRVGKAYTEQLEALVASLDPKVVRYGRYETPVGETAGSRAPGGDLGCDPKAIPWIPHSSGTHHFVEVVWSSVRPDTFGLAQLVDDTWLYSAEGQVVGLVLSDLPEIIETYALIGTAEIAVPILDYPVPV